MGEHCNTAKGRHAIALPARALARALALSDDWAQGMITGDDAEARDKPGPFLSRRERKLNLDEEIYQIYGRQAAVICRSFPLLKSKSRNAGRDNLLHPSSGRARVGQDAPDLGC